MKMSLLSIFHFSFRQVVYQSAEVAHSVVRRQLRKDVTELLWMNN